MASKRKHFRQEAVTSQVATAPAKRTGFWLEFLPPFITGAVIVGTITAAATYGYLSRPKPQPLQINPVASASKSLPTLGDLVVMDDEQLARQDLALVNLRCAEGLPGCEKLDVNKSLQTLDKWAAHIKTETDRHLYRATDPKFAAYYKNSEAYYRASMLVQVLQEDLGVRYNLERVQDVDFTKPADLFVHGMIGNRNGGTCVSMPVLYTAMGRRLGYPIKLVTAKAHVFCRWESPKVRFNIEGSGEGFSSFDDEYYTRWPKSISKDELASGQYLKSLTPREELAVFLAARGHCLEDNGRLNDCYVAYAQANVLAPEHPVYGFFLSQVVMRQPEAMGMAQEVFERRLKRAQQIAAMQQQAQQASAAHSQLPGAFQQQVGYRGMNSSDPMQDSLGQQPMGTGVDGLGRPLLPSSGMQNGMDGHSPSGIYGF